MRVEPHAWDQCPYKRGFRELCPPCEDMARGWPSAALERWGGPSPELRHAGVISRTSTSRTVRKRCLFL